MGRMCEPSTWAGIAALLEVAKFAAPQYAGLIVALQGVAGSVAVAVRESGNGGQ